MSPEKIQHYGDTLYQALVSRRAIAPLTETESGTAIADAYRIQLRMIARRLVDSNERVIGKKIGVTEAVAVAWGDVINVRYQHLGSVSVRFV